MDGRSGSSRRWSPDHWNAVSHALERAWVEGGLSLPAFEEFRDRLRDEMRARGMLTIAGWSSYSHDQLLAILRGVFPYGEAWWQDFRVRVELHLFHAQPGA